MSALPVVLKARSQHTATMIFLHGLGDTGHGWAAGLNSIRPDYMKIVCPTAPSIPVTLNQGYKMPAWYDIRHLDDDRSSTREDLDGVEASTKVLQSLGKQHALKSIPSSLQILAAFGYFWGSIRSNTTLVVQFHEIFVTEIRFEIRNNK